MLFCSGAHSVELNKEDEEERTDQKGGEKRPRFLDISFLLRGVATCAHIFFFTCLFVFSPRLRYDARHGRTYSISHHQDWNVAKKKEEGRRRQSRRKGDQLVKGRIP